MAHLTSMSSSLSLVLGVKHNECVRVTAKVDYAVRALLELAVANDGPVKGERIAQAQEIPLKFLENILIDLRHANIVRAQRGADGGYWLARPAGEVTLGEIIRAVEGPLASVRGEPPEDVNYTGAAENLRTVWVAVRASLRAVVDELTLADVVADRLPTRIRRLTEAPDAWSRR
jgi:Rrf2 family protein